MKEKGHLRGVPTSLWPLKHTSALGLYGRQLREKTQHPEGSPGASAAFSQPCLPPVPSTAASDNWFWKHFESALGPADFTTVSLTLGVWTRLVICCHLAPRGSPELLETLRSGP